MTIHDNLDRKNAEKCRGHRLCEREITYEDFCALHLPLEYRTDSPSVEAIDEILINELRVAKLNSSAVYELHWEGIIFPKNHILFDFKIFEEVKEKLKKAWINLDGAEIQSIRVGSYEMESLIFSNSKVQKETMIPVVRIGRISFGGTVFKGKFHCASNSREIDARNSVFEDEFSFASQVEERANFSSCRFNCICRFHGNQGPIFGVDATKPEKFKVAGFDYAVFGNPAQTIFQDVNLRKSSFKSVSLVGVRFYNTSFFQPSLSRNGIHKEVKEIEKNKPKSLFINWRSTAEKSTSIRIDHIIHEYRQLRLAMEASKDFTKSHDFYIGEMDSRQRKEWSFVLWTYKVCSQYGVNYKRAFVVLIGLILTHLTFTTAISFQYSKICFYWLPTCSINIQLTKDIISHSLATVTLQKFGLMSGVSFIQNLVDIIFRVVVPVQVAMFILALRNKTKR